MKNIRILLLALLVITLSGCATTNQKNASAFLATVASMDISAADVSQTTKGPFYNHSESIAGLAWSPSGFTISNLKASFDIPMPVMGIPLIQWTLSASALSGTKPSAPALGSLAAAPAVK